MLNRCCSREDPALCRTMREKRMSKRVMMLILILVLILSLAGCGRGTDETGPAQTAEGGADYTITVSDQNGDPVAGAVVNICTDTTCEPQTADENGFIYYSGEMANYHLEVIRVPDGYDIGDDADLYTGEETQFVIQVVKE